ncbi:MAG: hypothetical protein HKP41_14895 [Desulfobacterales bacterium]|nr:hypothetical protein [Bacteroidia bacterium]NNK95636.1 hypothetical protein [Desulfobacterales bacterium]
MKVKEEVTNIVNKLKTERDELKLKMHLATKDAKVEFEAAEKKWQQLKAQASDINSNVVETSNELLSDARIIGEELKETYKRITKRLKK